ncbi:MAG TPA: multiheme c-type cytochrome [Pyrinomonadaceae bacterium]
MRDGIKTGLALVFLLAGAAVLAGPALRGAWGQARAESPLARWRPGGRDDSGVRYVGSAACATCHAEEAGKQASTPMGRASARAADCEILKTHTRLNFRNGRYRYEIRREGAESLYTVTDGVAEISEPVLFCFGEGAAGQTYIFRHRGAYYESRVSYFRAPDRLDVTIEHPRAEPSSLEDALGRPMTDEAARGCYACHTTPAPGAAGLRPERVAAGVSCEACHGPGEKHLAAVKAKDLKNLNVYNPARLGGLELSQEFCGACHQSFDTVMGLEGQGGAANVRFQPYRAFNSRGHLTDDRRMSCVACHDPHGPLERDPVKYDANCLSCHLATPKERPTRERAAAPCPVSTKQCVTCHMPKVELPSMHFKFTDHWVRIARPGAPVPR